VEQAEAGARARLGPAITAVFEAVGLRPGSAPERVALKKMAAESTRSESWWSLLMKCPG